MRGGVGLGEDAGAGLDEDLLAGEVAGFGGEVGVFDRGVAGGDVFEGDLQGVDVGLESVAFEGTEAAAEDGDLVDGVIDDGGGLAGVVGEGGGAAGFELGEVAVIDVSELVGVDGSDGEG